MKMEARVLAEPIVDLLGFVGTVVIGNAMNVQMLGSVAVNDSEKFQELLMTMIRC